jgi:glycosyltransferase involved in cell wall biosynthesis
VRALYISHNGMLEGLGHSQVLPYLRGLARRGVEIDLLSYELEADAAAVAALRESLAASSVRWTPLVRRRDTRLVRKVQESANGALRALATALARRPDIVHGRSYLPTAVADVVASTFPRARLVFDCRGLLGDENVDAGHWTKDRLEYRLAKRYEARAFRRAEGIVVLTEALRRWADDHGWIGASSHIEVIPCCVDLEAFRFDAAARTRVRRELGVEDRLVLVYSGSLGSWYREADIARFAGIARKRAGRRIAFLLLTPSAPDVLTKMLREEGLDDDEIIVRKVRPADMPSHLAAGDLGI